jgi:hypothetical protein
MTLVAIPLHAPPEQGMMLISEMLFMGASFGVAFTFFVLGVGMNLGTFAWIGWTYGLKVLARLMAMVIPATVALGFAMPVALPSLEKDAVTSRRFYEIESQTGTSTSWMRLVQNTLNNAKGEPQWFLIGALSILGILAVAGVASRRLGERGTLRAWAEEPEGAAPNANRRSRILSRPLSAPQLALAALFVFLALAFAGLYVYYPAPVVLLDEMTSVQTELNFTVRSSPVNRPDALRFIAQWERLQKKLAVGDFLRRGRSDPVLQKHTEELRAALDRLRRALEEGKPAAELAALHAQAREAASKCRETVARTSPSADADSRPKS